MNPLDRLVRFNLRETALLFLFRSIKAADEQGRHLLRAMSEFEDPGRLADMIRTFELRATTYHSHSLVLELIQAAPRLTRLEIHYLLDQSRYTRRNSACIINGDVLSSTLRSVKNTLEHLRISYGLSAVGPTHPSRTTRGFCSLKQLHRLQTANIPLFLLLGWDPKESPTLADILPCNLRTLRFGDDKWGYRCTLSDENLMMEKFVERFGGESWRDSIPELNRVILSLWWYDESKEDDTYTEWRTGGGESGFRQLCAENELQCKVIRNE